MELMSTKGVRHLPVLENEIVIGIISISGKSNYRNAKDTIQHLNSYYNRSN
jgi:predicted transcriptional regulator